MLLSSKNEAKGNEVALTLAESSGEVGIGETAYELNCVSPKDILKS